MGQACVSIGESSEVVSMQVQAWIMIKDRSGGSEEEE